MGFSGQEYWSRLPFPYLLAHRVAIVSGEKKLYDMIIYRENTEEFTDKPLELGKLLDKG